MAWRDSEWWHLQQAIGLTYDPGNEHLQWRHTKPGKSLHWEDLFVKPLGDRWKTSAATGEWAKALDDFVGKAYALLNARVLEQRFAKRRRKCGHDMA